MKLTREDHLRVAGAIRQAETRTSGEIFCVLDREVSRHWDVGMAWSAGLALVSPLAMIALGFDPNHLPGLNTGWTAAHLSQTAQTVSTTLGAAIALQALVFGAAMLLWMIVPLRRLLTPAPLRRARVEEAAMRQFMAHGLHTTAARTGVLIFASLRDHEAVVIADEGIAARVEPVVWGEAVADLISHLKRRQAAAGFIAAIERCTTVLAQHFPPGADNPNELPDKLLEL